MPRNSTVTVEKPKEKNSKPTEKNVSLAEKLQTQFESNQSYLSLALGLLIIFAVGILVFNYFKHNQGTVGTAQNTDNTQTEEQANQQADVSPDNLPGKYTVKSGDTLFKIAQKYYNDGYKYPDLAKANNISNVNVLEVGQILDIPKLSDQSQMAQNTSTSSSSNKQTVGDVSNIDLNSTGTGGATNDTEWGPKITGDTYTVVQGDWLSKIAGRAYGDIMQFDKIAKANNISNPDVIEPGTVLKIPR